jgi:hypothetical protein
VLLLVDMVVVVVMLSLIYVVVLVVDTDHVHGAPDRDAG